MENNTQIAGAITEQKCFMKCIEQGYIVSKPLFDNARYDFILDTGKRLLKIQVKTSRWKDDEHSAFVFNCYSQHSTGNGNKRMRYSNKDIDYFMTTRDDVFYLYPAPQFRKKHYEFFLQKVVKRLISAGQKTILLKR